LARFLTGSRPPPLTLAFDFVIETMGSTTTALHIPPGILLFAILLLGADGVTLTGVVQDPSKAGVPGATIALVLESANRKVQEAISNEDGSFSLKSIPPGDYLLRVDARGFETYEKAVVVGAEEPASLKVKLKLGAFKQQLTVEADSSEDLSTSASDASSIKLDDALLRGLPTQIDDLQSLIERFVSPAAQGAEGTSIIVDGIEGGQIDVPLGTTTK